MTENEVRELEALRLLWSRFGPDCVDHGCVMSRTHRGMRTNGAKCRCLDGMTGNERTLFLMAARTVYQARAARCSCHWGSVCSEECGRSHHNGCPGI